MSVALSRQQSSIHRHERNTQAVRLRDQPPVDLVGCSARTRPNAEETAAVAPQSGVTDSGDGEPGEARPAKRATATSKGG